ncbi:hypothetical protein [Gordonia paraffinivorans]|uniref:hypothetical protein n=1 Tax=Gordonia paraffinivorans TaxID=175628 RepID=UPI0021B363B0|nr:hypothetical protein [Gordonia paraffinivorans]
MNVRRALCAGLVAASLVVGGAGFVGSEAAAAPVTRCVPASTPESEQRLADLTDASKI